MPYRSTRGYGRGYSRSPKYSAKRYIIGSLTLTAGNVHDEAITIPGIPEQLQGCELFSIQWEIPTTSVDGWWVDTKYMWLALSSKTLTAEVYYDDPETLWKYKHECWIDAAPTTSHLFQLTHTEKFLEPPMVVGPTIHFGGAQDTANDVTVYYKICYRLKRVTQMEAIATYQSLQY